MQYAFQSCFTAFRIVQGCLRMLSGCSLNDPKMVQVFTKDASCGFINALRMFNVCFKDASTLQACFEDASMMLLGCLEDASQILQICTRMHLE